MTRPKVDSLLFRLWFVSRTYAHTTQAGGVTHHQLLT
jgi:hypothetical protein